MSRLFFVGYATLLHCCSGRRPFRPGALRPSVSMSCRTERSGDPVSRAEITGARVGHSGSRVARCLCSMTAERALVLGKTYPPPSNLLHNHSQAHAFGQLGERPSVWCGLDGATVRGNAPCSGFVEVPLSPTVLRDSGCPVKPKGASTEN